MIYQGAIHAFTSRTMINDSNDFIQIPIIVESDDVIAFGNDNDVCFFKYKISRDTWRKIIKRSNQ
ncbi:MAG: hypothetical protein PHF86_12600 [Candidatus Nanoarchaeia archaeon]|jgi:hypothetical protein|nr:hypothetical protein [Candidatus Nanoarchaeia archaeon]